MEHYKSKSYSKEGSNKENENKNNNTTIEYNSTTVIKENSINDNINFDLSTTKENTDKISSLFIEQDNDEKIVNISKLDESFNNNNIKTNREDKNGNLPIQNSEYGIVTNKNKDNEDNSDSKPIVNISFLETQNNELCLEEIIKNEANNFNIAENNQSQNSTIYKHDEAFHYKKRKRIYKYKIIIFLICIIVLVIFSLIGIFILNKFFF